MEVIKLALVAVIGVILVVMVQQQKKEIGILLAVTVGTVLLLMVIPQLKEILNVVSGMAETAGLSTAQMQLILKLLAAGYIIEFGSEICRDAGQQALAAKVQLGGRLIMAGMALPVFQSLLQLISELLT